MVTSVVSAAVCTAVLPSDAEGPQCGIRSHLARGEFSALRWDDGVLLIWGIIFSRIRRSPVTFTVTSVSSVGFFHFI